MDFFELEAYAALARHRHFARAAAAVHTSPSALSRLLVRLEQEVGSRLLDRETRTIRLTEAGQLFLTFAEDSLRQRDALHLRIGSTDQQLRGTLRIYASVTACYSLLPPLVEALRRVHPELKLSVETGDPADAERALREGAMDLALAAIPETGFPDMESFSVRRTPLVFVAGPGVSTPLLTPDTLSQHPLILPQRGLARDRFDRWVKDHKIRPIIAAETAGNEAILALARLSLGLGLVPKIVLENSPFAEGLTVHSLRPGFADYDIGFVLPGANSILKGLLETVYPQGIWKSGYNL